MKEISVPELCSTSLWSNRFTSRWKCWDILHRVNTLASDNNPSRLSSVLFRCS